MIGSGPKVGDSFVFNNRDGVSGAPPAEIVEAFAKQGLAFERRPDLDVWARPYEQVYVLVERVS